MILSGLYIYVTVACKGFDESYLDRFNWLPVSQVPEANLVSVKGFKFPSKSLVLSGSRSVATYLSAIKKSFDNTPSGRQEAYALGLIDYLMNFDGDKKRNYSKFWEEGKGQRVQLTLTRYFLNSVLSEKSRGKGNSKPVFPLSSKQRLFLGAYSVPLEDMFMQESIPLSVRYSFRLEYGKSKENRAFAQMLMDKKEKSELDFQFAFDTFLISDDSVEGYAIKESKLVAEKYVRFFPRSATAFYLLMNAQMWSGEKDLARKSAEKAIELGLKPQARLVAAQKALKN